ncbi:hypothetical protein [Ligilactobacillus ceti]|uniref:Uncharacterized protein n=1 Tax=Ligilactobacillus ceti DSM 22408 TaxID=1122146 RepID=A0A0R2KHA3_9LACO|nr:hypothetical protein [Ligilactobacillus ceti]KRN88761.1 hypothetical protein IV53_GL000729 [Ligilactobacillus ceti DSM 22408]
MQSSKSIIILRTLWYIAFAATFSFILPIVCTMIGLDEIKTMAIVLVSANAIYAVVSGLVAGKLDHSGLYLLIFPILYALGAHFFFEKYALFLVVAYLIFTYLAYGIAKK